MDNKKSIGVVIFADESSPKLESKEIKKSFSRISFRRKKVFLKKLFNFPNPMRSIEIKDWQVILYLRKSMFSKNKGTRYRLAGDEKLTFFFITADQGFIEDARTGFINYSRKGKVPNDINLNEKGKMVFSRSIYNPSTKRSDRHKTTVHIVYLMEQKKRLKIKEIFKMIEDML